MIALRLLSECPRCDCSIEHIDYYRCVSCGRDFVVRSGEEEEFPDDHAVLVEAAFGWVRAPSSA